MDPWQLQDELQFSITHFNALPRNVLILLCLFEVTSGTVDVHVVKGDHDTFVRGSSSGKTASLIMQTLLAENNGGKSQ